MKTTPEQRAALRRAYVVVGHADAREVAVLDDLDEALAEVAALRVVAEAAKGVAAWTMHTDQSTRSGTLGMLRAALRAWEERER